MALQVNVYGLNYNLAFDYVDKVNNCIVCSIQNSTIEYADVDYPLMVEDSFNPSGFEIYLLTNKYLVENNIYEVCDTTRNNRIGWCFPIQALGSTEHSYADNEHFLRYAYVAAIKLLKDEFTNVFKYAPSILDSSVRLKFEDFFPENTAILVISLEKIGGETQLNIGGWIPSLYVHGYIPLKHRNPKYISMASYENDGSRLYIQAISQHLPNTSFVELVFSELLAYETNTFLKFFYLYQIIELLIEDVFRNEHQLLFDGVMSEKDLLKIKDMLDKLRDISSEKQRLHLLISNYITNPFDCSDLKNACNQFLINCGNSVIPDPMTSLYTVRNILFHRYRDYQTNHDDIETVVSEFITFLVELLQQYRVREK